MDDIGLNRPTLEGRFVLGFSAGPYIGQRQKGTAAEACGASIFTPENTSGEQMQRIIAEQIEPRSGAVIGTRTVQVKSVDFLLQSSALARGIVEGKTDRSEIRLLVSGAPQDYQRASVYGEDDQLLASLSYRNGYVVYETSELPSGARRGAVHSSALPES